MDDYLYTQNPNPTFTQLSQILDPYYEVANNHSYEVGLDQDLSSQFSDCSENNIGYPTVPDGENSSLNSMELANGMVKNKERQKETRVAIRTKSALEILDDGFKWRKYGKKMMKNSPNPRNYYKCSNEGCSVKKRVERDGKDPSYVVTTYEGIHNHESPSMVYCNTTPNTIPHALSFLPSNPLAHPSP